MTVVRINEFKSAEGKSDELHAFLTSLLPYITSSEGCISCEVLRNSDSTDDFVVIERWQSKDDHIQSIANFPKEEMQAAMSLFAGAPQGAYYVE